MANNSCYNIIVSSKIVFLVITSIKVSMREILILKHYTTLHCYENICIRFHHFTLFYLLSDRKWIHGIFQSIQIYCINKNNPITHRPNSEWDDTSVSTETKSRSLTSSYQLTTSVQPREIIFHAIFRSFTASALRHGNKWHSANYDKGPPDYIVSCRHSHDLIFGPISTIFGFSPFFLINRQTLCFKWASSTFHKIKNSN